LQGEADLFGNEIYVPKCLRDDLSIGFRFYDVADSLKFRIRNMRKVYQHFLVDDTVY